MNKITPVTEKVEPRYIRLFKEIFQEGCTVIVNRHFSHPEYEGCIGKVTEVTETGTILVKLFDKPDTIKVYPQNCLATIIAEPDEEIPTNILHARKWGFRLMQKITNDVNKFLYFPEQDIYDLIVNEEIPQLEQYLRIINRKENESETN